MSEGDVNEALDVLQTKFSGRHRDLRAEFERNFAERGEIGPELGRQLIALRPRRQIARREDLRDAGEARGHAAVTSPPRGRRFAGRQSPAA